jgi:hypothetical protein
VPYPRFHDIYVPGTTNDNIPCVSQRLYSMFLATFGKRQLWSVMACDPAIWDVVDGGGPAAPQVFRLWTFGTVYEHNTARLSKVTVLDGFPYGFAAYSSEGWVLFKIAHDSRGVTGLFAIDHFKFDSLQPNSQWIYGHAIWQGNNLHYYALGRYMDKTNGVLQIVDLGTGQADPVIDASSIRASLPAASQSSRFFVLKNGSSIYLYQFGKLGLHVYDITDPASPSYVGVNAHPGLIDLGMSADYGPALGWGPIVIQKKLTGGSKVYRIYTRCASDSKIHIFDATNPLAPVELASAPGRYDGSGTYGVPLSAVSTDGNLLAEAESVSSSGGVLLPGKMLRLFAVGNDTFTEIPTTLDWVDDQGSFHYENAADIAVVPPVGGGPYHVAQSTMLRGYVHAVDPACVRPAPRPPKGAADARR